MGLPAVVCARFLWRAGGRSIDGAGTRAAGSVSLTWRPLPTGHSPPPCSHHRAPPHASSFPSLSLFLRIRSRSRWVGERSLRCNGAVFSMGRGPPSCPHAAPPRLPHLPPHAPRRPLRRCRERRQGQLGVPGGRRVPAPLAPDLLETQVGSPHPHSIDRLFCLFAVSISSKPDELTDARAMAPVRHRVFLYQNFLSYDEANHLISLVSATLPPPVHRTLVSDVMKARN